MKIGNNIQRHPESSWSLRRWGAFLSLWFASVLLAGDSRPLSLDEAVALTLTNHRALEAARARADAARAAWAEAHAAAGPVAHLSGGYAYLSTVPEFSIPAPSPSTGLLTLNPTINNTYQFTLAAHQPLWSGGRLARTRDAAEARAYAAQEEWAGRRADLVLAASRAYWTLARAVAEQEVVEEDLAVVRAHLADVERFLAEGMATNADRLKVEARLSLAQFRHIAADHAVRSASMTLASLAGLSADTVLTPRSPLPPLTDDFLSAETLTIEAAETRPELKAMRLQVEAARASAGIARAERLPQISLSAHYLFARPNARLFPAEDRFNDTWDIGLGVSLDLWDGGATAQRIQQAEARIREAEAALALASDDVALEVRRALLSLEEARALAAAAETGMRQAEEDLRITRERFREGLAPNTEVLDAELALLDARLRHTGALTAHAIARAELNRAVGR